MPPPFYYTRLMSPYRCYQEVDQNMYKTKRKEAVSMAKVKVTGSNGSTKKMRPALTPEARENQLISLAVDLAEQQLRDGTASSQVITHYLKLGTEKEKLERERLREDINVLKAKARAYDSSEEIKSLYSDALSAMKRYSGNGDKAYDD
jgi:cell division septum initiation protein DivIVA